jgi:hypothetical protein
MADEIAQLPQRSEFRQAVIGEVHTEALLDRSKKPQGSQAVQAKLAHQVVINAGATKVLA